MFVAERFIGGGLVKINGKHPVSTDGGTWYPIACRFLGLEHHKSFLLREKHYRKDDALYQGQNQRKF